MAPGMRSSIFALLMASAPELLSALAIKAQTELVEQPAASRMQALLSFLASHAKRFAGMQDPDFKSGGGPHIVVDGNGQAVTDQELIKQQIAAGCVYLTTIVVWAVVVYLVAQWYISSVRVKMAPKSSSAEEMLNEFKHGPFDCFSDPKTSCWVCFCPSIRWADNVSSMGIMRSFWLAMLIYFGLFAIFSVKGDILGLILIACIGAGFRRELRMKFKMPVSAALFAQDCMFWACCSCCALVQEARQVEEAYKLGHPAVVDAEESEASA